MEGNSTKEVLASSLKVLMRSKPFKKITIADITDGCNLNRKSFYYHFQDKYDLVNWIFTSEFQKRFHKIQSQDPSVLFSELSLYLNENRAFYKKTFLIEGQNSFSTYLKEYLRPYALEFLQVYSQGSLEPYYVDVLIDSLAGMYRRWIIEQEEIKEEQFLAYLNKYLKLFDKGSTRLMLSGNS
jgi:probable dihydroxyacetone kinase regulator